MYSTLKLLAIIAALTTPLPLIAQEDRVELDTTIIKGNTELPKILYVVPWKDLDGKSSSQQKLILHSMFGDLFDPVSPLPPSAKQIVSDIESATPTDEAAGKPPSSQASDG